MEAMNLWIELLQALLGGISIGCIYGLVALGFVLIYKATDIINFAQGELMMIGAFICLTFVNFLSLPYWMAFPLTLLMSGVFGVVLYRLVIRPLVGEPIFAIVMVTIGFGIFARSIVSCIPGWGTQTYGIKTPFADRYLDLQGAVVSMEHVAIIVITTLLILLLFCFFRFTRLGVSMQAVSENQLAAAYMGVSIRRIFALTWAISAAVAAVAGVLLAPITFVHVNMGYIGLKAFPAAILGGFGSIPGALVGGLIIGVSESLAGLYLPMGLKDIAAYIILILVLMIRPEGLFGIQKTKKV